MTYLTTAFSENGIAMGSDGRAHHFDDWEENGKVVGKIVSSYWDGNRKTFLLKHRIGVSAQGVLYWGDERRLLSAWLHDFEKKIVSSDSILEVSQKLLDFFRRAKRRGSHEFEVMHFLVAGFERGEARTFYINTFGAGTVENVCPDKMPRGIINGDGQTEEIFNPDCGEKTLVRFAKREILRVHHLRPFDVGRELDILAIPRRGGPYWVSRQKSYSRYVTYDRYTAAVQSGKIKVIKLHEPLKLRYRLKTHNG